MSVYLTPLQISERWNCSPRHVTRLLNAGRLVGMRISPTDWRVLSSVVEAFEASNTQQPADEPVTTSAQPQPAPVLVDFEHSPDFELVQFDRQPRPHRFGKRSAR